MPTKSNRIIGKRIRLARDMAGNITQKALQAQLTTISNKSGTLGNYERGGSRPRLEIIEEIAKVTGTSPCWLMFGHGPIRSNRESLPALQAVRHQNLSKILVLLAEDPSTLSKKEVRNLRQIPHFHLDCAAKDCGHPTAEQLLYDHENEIDGELCKEIETALKKHEGWMSEQHIDTDPVLEAFPQDIREIIALYSESPEFRPHIENSVNGLANLLKELKSKEKKKKKK